MALFRCLSDGGSGGTSGAVLLNYDYGALNQTKTMTGLEVGKTYTYIAVQSGNRDCSIASVSNATWTQKQNTSSSAQSYSVTWITPTSTSVTITHTSASSAGVFKLWLYGATT